MSVSGIPPSVPAGFDLLFPNGVPGTSATPPATTPSTTTPTSTTSGSSTTQIPSNIPGADILNGQFNGATVPGFDVLQPAAYFPGQSSSKSSSSSTSSTSTSAPQTIQQEYDQFEQSVNATLLGSVEGNSPSIPQYAGGSADSLAQLDTTLAAIKPLVGILENEQQGTTTAPTGTNINTLA